ncbi:hypothetical protein B0H17DRAFT_1217055 [Mycena rosella]|uniref:Uncharacterized protein n=1 Tax=Mycena rosella TaxID=1033263 RepID=A0AAD7C4M0_MYCRO|nr:hypothetical protein B0H17DRAFT_1217055 [Mycena rosella]
MAIRITAKERRAAASRCPTWPFQVRAFLITGPTPVPTSALGLTYNAPEEQDPYDDRDMMPMDRTPAPDSAQHARKRSNQWRRWQQESLRYCDTLRKIALVRFSSVEDIELEICECTPAAVQLMKYGAFPCAPFHPSLAVDLAYSNSP